MQASSCWSAAPNFYIRFREPRAKILEYKLPLRDLSGHNASSTSRGVPRRDMQPAVWSDGWTNSRSRSQPALGQLQNMVWWARCSRSSSSETVHSCYLETAGPGIYKHLTETAERDCCPLLHFLACPTDGLVCAREPGQFFLWEPWLKNLGLRFCSSLFISVIQSVMHRNPKP